MAGETVNKRKGGKVDIQNLSQRDLDFLRLEVPEVMVKYNLEKQGVYDRRFALYKELRAADLTVEDVLNNAAVKKKVAKKAKAVRETPELKSSTELQLTENEPSTEVLIKPIELKFDNFFIKLNGSPKKISVNLEANTIEIDL